jgi:predicted regulator of Ras-like GTPase activity (Roadblock/LC7/MglB family)
MTKADLLARALDEFLATSPDIEAAAVVSADGLPMASALPPHVEEDRLAAMSAAILTLGERAAMGLGKGGLAQVFVEGEDGYVVLMAAGGNAVLVAVTSRGAKVGLLLFEMRRAAARVATVMDEVPSVPPAPPEPTMVEETSNVVERALQDVAETTHFSEEQSSPAFADARPSAPADFESGNSW